MINVPFVQSDAQAGDGLSLASHFFAQTGRNIGFVYNSGSQILSIYDDILTVPQAQAILATFVFVATPKPLDTPIGDFANARLAMGTAVASFQALPANPTTAQLKTVIGQLGIATRDGFIAMGTALQQLRDGQ